MDLLAVFCISDFTLYSVLTNEEEFADYLHRNLSLPLDDINTLINSTVNIHEVNKCTVQFEVWREISKLFFGFHGYKYTDQLNINIHEVNKCTENTI